MASAVPFDARFRRSDGEIWFEDRQSRRLAEEPTLFNTSMEESLAWMYQQSEDPKITAVTPVAKWYAGEQMDWEHAVALLFD